MCSSELNLDVSVKAIIADILRLFNKQILLKDFINEMKIINENQISLHYTDYVIIKRHITNKSDFKEKIDKLKQHSHSVYKLVLKTCASLLSDTNEINISVLNQSMEITNKENQMSQKISQEDLKKLVDNKVQKPNTLIKNMDESTNDSCHDSKKDKFNSMQNILDTLNALEIRFGKSTTVLLSDRITETTLANHSFADQEQVLISDLIKLLTGLDGDYIWRDRDNFGQFKFCDGIRRNFLKIIDSILPLVVNYYRIEEFAKTQLFFKSGSVNNALADALLNILLVERIFINDMGRKQMLGNFNIHNLWKKLTHLIDSSQFLSNIVDKHIKENAFGGKTLSILYDIIKSNNHNEQYFEVVLDLLKKSSAPYLEMLNGWLKNGSFFDPFMEFMIVDKRAKKDIMMTMINSCNFDENRYSLRPKDQIPMFLQNCSEMILVAGKTRIILQKLHLIKKNDKLETIGIYLKHNYYIDTIEKIYNKFNMELKDFIDKSDFRQRLYVMKRFMLLERGDFIYQLLSECEPFLSKELTERTMIKVQNIFESVKKSFLYFLPRNIKASDIKLEFLSYDLNYELKKILELNSSASEISFASEETGNAHVMTGFDFVSLAVNISWPFSIMFTPCIIENYKLLFRHLFYYKWIEYSLCGIWWLINNAENKANAKTIFYFRMISALRVRMLSTIQIIQYYIMNEVIESHFKDFLKKLDDPNLCIDSIIEYHRQFISDCLLESMLIDKNIYGTMYKLLMLTRQFCEFVQKVDESDAGDFSNLTFNYFTQSNEDSFNAGFGVNDTVERFDLQYTLLILQLFDALRSTHNNKLICLITRIIL